MNRFFVDQVGLDDKYIILNDSAQLHHLKDVLRIKLLERVVVFDNFGNEYLTVVVEITTEAVKLEVKEKRLPKDPGARLTVACAIPKKVKMDDIVDKLTQLGVECIIPLETERVIVRLDEQKKAERFARWQKIALSAAKQSQRSRLTVIKPISDFKDALLAAGEFDLKLIPTLEGERKTLKNEILRACGPQNDEVSRKIIVLIGPEGDFTPQEVALAMREGFIPVTLGDLVLRVDTAAVATASFIKLYAQS